LIWSTALNSFCNRVVPSSATAAITAGVLEFLIEIHAPNAVFHGIEKLRGAAAAQRNQHRVLAITLLSVSHF